MEESDENDFNSDLDDELIDMNKLQRLTFDETVATHRSNRLEQTFGQMNLLYDESQSVLRNKTDDETLVPLRLTTSDKMSKVDIYERSCQILDVADDSQIRTALAYDNIVIVNRSISFNHFRAFSTAIGSNLETLVLNSVGLTPRSVSVLCQGLQKCFRLTLLDLSNNKIGRKGFDSLLDILDDFPSLLYLSLVNCAIQDYYGIRIGDLCRSKTLLEVNLSGNALNEKGCIFIGHAISENATLSCLNISWNSIRYIAPIALLRGFEVNQTLTDLDISWNGVGYDGCVALRRVLTLNKSLKRLNIRNCNIEWISAKLISQGLMKNSTLLALNMAFNPLTTHGIDYIVQAINAETSVLTELDLTGLGVFASTIRLAEDISKRREFVMKYDFEMPVHDIIGREAATKGDSMRKIIEHIDLRHWRTLDFFRLLVKNNASELDKRTIAKDILRSGIKLENHDVKNIHERFTRPSITDLTYKTVSHILIEQRLSDRSMKIRQQKKAELLRNRNRKILETVSQHFPNIEIISRRQKHKDTIAKLSKPRAFSAHVRS